MTVANPCALMVVAAVLAGCACGASSPTATSPTDAGGADDTSTDFTPERDGPAIEAAPREPVVVSPL